MDAAELEATIARLDAMSRRCDAVIERENCKPGQVCKPMKILKPRPKVKPQNVEFRGYSSAQRAVFGSSDNDRRPNVVDNQPGSIEDIFADFEAQFDEMAQAYRA